jgi:GMP synthase-like glutamine amidotransferase
MKIAILDLCQLPEPLEGHGRVGSMIHQWLGPHLPEASFVSIDVANGEPLPAVDAFDGYVVSGSEKGVYDETVWMEPLKAFLRELKAARIPVFGICFGHQVMAEAYGGKAEKAEGSLEVGARKYQRDGKEFSARAMHGDQVVEVPPEAQVTMSASYCPVAALDYDFPAKSIQFHPEYSEPFVSDTIDLFDGQGLDEDQAVNARTSLSEQTVEVDFVGQETAEFFRKAIQKNAAA